jgi:hypothetical protein
MARTTTPKGAKAGEKGIPSHRREGEPPPTEAAEGAHAAGPPNGPSSRRPGRLTSKLRTSGPVGGSGGEGIRESGNLETGTDLLHQWREWRTKFLIGAATVLTGAMGIWLASWLGFFAGPHTAVASAPYPSIKPIIDPGHLPGRQDVSTMAFGYRFFAVPNFYYFQSCGRPCWLPLYQLPTEKSAFVTDGWPCEYYGPNHSSAPSCIRPPSRRTPSEMADRAVRDSGDRLLVLCQTARLSTGRAAGAIRNQVGQSSDIWDMVALPKSYISSDSPAIGKLTQVSRMPGFYQAFAPDIWLGNTGWHRIACRSLNRSVPRIP